MPSAATPALTEYESLVLAIVARDGPTTAYRVLKRVGEALGPGFSGSPGTIYPIVARLKKRGLVAALAVHTDARNTELLMVSATGRAAARRWVKSITPALLLPEDPLRSRVALLEILTQAERGKWLEQVRASLAAQLEALEASPPAEDPVARTSNKAARLVSRARLDWLDEVLADREQPT